MTAASSSLHRALGGGALLALVALGVPSPVAAQNLSPAIFRELVFSNAEVPLSQQQVAGRNERLAEQISYSVTDPFGAVLSGYANAAGGFQPSFEIGSSASGGGDRTVSSSVSIFYSVRLDGPAYGTPVNMVLHTAGWATASGNVSSSYAQVNVESNLANFRFSRQVQTYALNGIYADAFDVSLPFAMLAGVTYQVSMYGTADSKLGSTSAYLDPSFSFAPGTDSTGYQLSYSPGLVPEPASAALLLMGLFAVVAVRRRGGSAS